MANYFDFGNATQSTPFTFRYGDNIDNEQMGQYHYDVEFNDKKISIPIGLYKKIKNYLYGIIRVDTFQSKYINEFDDEVVTIFMTKDGNIVEICYIQEFKRKCLTYTDENYNTHVKVYKVKNNELHNKLYHINAFMNMVKICANNVHVFNDTHRKGCMVWTDQHTEALKTFLNSIY